MDIAFRAPRVEHYNEEQATVVRIEDVNRAKEECLITCIRTTKYLEGLRTYYNHNIKGHSFAIGDLILHKNRKLKGCTNSPPPGKGLTWSKRLPDQGLTGYVTWTESISPIHDTSSTLYMSILETLQICILHSIMNEVFCRHNLSPLFLYSSLISIYDYQLWATP